MLPLVALAFSFPQKTCDQGGKCLTPQGSQRKPLATPLATVFLAQNAERRLHLEILQAIYDLDLPRGNYLADALPAAFSPLFETEEILQFFSALEHWGVNNLFHSH
jgi:hypothetical protein